MPPRTQSQKSKLPSNLQELVAVGPKHVSRVEQKRERDEKGAKPSTAHALVLRNGKYGARGTGEMVLSSKLSGWEKLDLLAEDLVRTSKKALLTPFCLEKCLKIAHSQYNAFLDDIAHLQDPDLFHAIIMAELGARTHFDPKHPDLARNPSYMASIIATKIHNSYFLASAWKIVFDTLDGLARDGISDKSVKTQLRNSESLRSRYLVLYDIVKVLVETGQAKLSVLATTTPHYSRFFKQTDHPDPGNPEVIFDWSELRDACQSFLDSIVIELCFPQSPYPRPILYQILHDAVQESPREAKRFSQLFWDAVGDLSVSLELQQLLEEPLLVPEGDAWKDSPREMPEEYERWFDAQIYSQKASETFFNYKDIVYPLERTKNHAVLENMWKSVNLNYQAVAGTDIDALWQLKDRQNRTPQWHSFYMPELAEDSDDSPDHLSAPPLKAKKSPRKPLAIASGAAEDSDNSMPELQSVSNSSSEDESDDDSDSDNSRIHDDYDEEDEDSGYDTEQEDELRNMLKTAMEAAMDADFFQSVNLPPTIDPFVEERKSNPFLKMLGSLRGRMFSLNPKLKVMDRSDHPEQTKPGVCNTITSETVAPSKDSLVTSMAIHPATKVESHGRPTATEQAKGKDDVPRPTKKKKKHKKKKIHIPESQQNTSPTVEKPSALVTPANESGTPPLDVPIVEPITTMPAKKSAPSGLRSPTMSSKSNAIDGVAPQMSTTSLSTAAKQTTAQSARSYLQSEKLDSQKTKIKSRPDYASLFSEPKKKSFLSKFVSGSARDKGEQQIKSGKYSWFTKLGKKTKGYMHQLLGTSEDKTKGIAPMKWENFLKLMREMGFEYDPSTAGSSVRFDPPDPRDPPITFHKPHPDPTLYPVKLKEFGKRLKQQYGWTEEDFLKHSSS